MRESNKIHYASDILGRDEEESPLGDKIRTLNVEMTLEKLLRDMRRSTPFYLRMEKKIIQRKDIEEKRLEGKMNKFDSDIREVKGMALENRYILNSFKESFESMESALPILNQIKDIESGTINLISESNSFYYFSIIITMVGLASLFYGINENILFYVLSGVFLIGLVAIKFFLPGSETSEGE